MEKQFQQRWEFRRNDDEVDSSSDDSKSSLSNERVEKKHKLVPILSSLEKDEAIDIQISQHNNQVDLTNGVHKQIAKDKKQSEPRNQKNAVDKKSKQNSGKKRKRKANQPTLDQGHALLGDLKIFTDSLLEELKVAREKMFVKMSKEMTKLVTAKPVLRSRRSNCVRKSGNKSGRKTQTCYEGLIKESIKENMAYSRKCSKAKRTNHEKVLESTKMEKGEAMSLAVKKPFHFPNESDQLGSSSYLTLPSVLPKPQTESLSLCNADNAEREKSLVDSNNHYSYLLGIQADEQFGSFDQISSKCMSFLDQQSSQTSSMHNVLPIPPHEWSNCGFNITNQSIVENPGQENKTVGLKMDGGVMGFAGISHDLPECFIANTTTKNMTYNSNGGFVSFSSRATKRDHF